MMKKILTLIFVAIALTAASVAQTTMNERPLPKGYNMMSAGATQVLGEVGDEVVFVVHPVRGILSHSQDYEVMALGKAGELRSVVLPDTRHDALVAATVTDGQVHVLLSSADKNQFVLNRAVIRVSDMRIVTPLTPMYSTTLAKSDWPYYKSDKSPNGDFVALVCGVYRNASKDFEGQEMMLDNTLDELWTKRYPVGMVVGLMVNDEGDMMAMDYYADEKSGRTQFRFAMLDEEGEEMQEAAFSGGCLGHVWLLNCVNGKFVLSAQLVDDPSRRSNINYSGICGIVYDMKSRKLTQSTHRFTAEEVNVLENRSLKFGRKAQPVVGGLTPMDAAATDFGGAIVMSRIYSVTTTGNTAASGTEYFLTGTLAMAVDTNATIMWVKPFRNYLKEAEHAIFFHNSLCADGNTVHLVQSEMAKGSLAYDINSTAKMKVVNGFKARTAVYSISPRGDVSKEMLGEVSKQKMATDLMPAGNGSYWFLTSMINNSTINRLKIK